MHPEATSYRKDGFTRPTSVSPITTVTPLFYSYSPAMIPMGRKGSNPAKSNEINESTKRELSLWKTMLNFSAGLGSHFDHSNQFLFLFCIPFRTSFSHPSSNFPPSRRSSQVMSSGQVE